MTRLALVVVLPVAAGCTETIELAHDPLGNLVSLEIAPRDAFITLRDLAPPHHTLQYQAIGHFKDGSVGDLTDAVTWSFGSAELGQFDTAGLFVATHAAVGRGLVSASVHEYFDTTTLAVGADITIVDATFPPPAANLFDPPVTEIASDATRSPQLVYPADGTLFPRDIARTMFQLARGVGNDATRLTFANDLLRLDVETGADRWAADGAVHQLLASAGALVPLRTEIRATSSASRGTTYLGATTNLAFTTDSPGGTLFFWSASTNGIMRAPLEATSAAKLYPSTSTCAGCHALSRDGAALAMSYENGATFDLQTIEVASQATTIAASTARPMGWATYSPDRTRLVVANNGALVQYDAKTGAALGSVPLPASRFATHPDWSPDGRALVVALTSQAPTNRDVRAASIAIIPFDGASWGTATVLVEGSTSSNNYFPRWSPDGQLLAFVRATAPSQGAASAELMVVPASGGTPMTLRTANRRVGRAELVALANTMPAWGPRRGERMWLAFVSARPYGIALPAGRSQIWLTSIDPTAVSDSSSAAFWLPSQDVTVLNYNPAWPSGGGLTL